MSFIEDTQILRVLRGLNPWWGTGQMPETLAPPVKRLAFHEVLSWLEHKDVHRAIILSGARRVGKTTVLYQLAQEYLNRGFQAQRIVYASFDHPILRVTPLQRVVEVFVNNISSDNHNLLLLFDEIHYASEWSPWLKRLVDENPSIQIIATGSVSVDLGAGGAESGVGRWLEIRVSTLSFYEYAQLRHLPIPIVSPHVEPTNLPELTPNERNRISANLAHLEPHFHRYLLSGGFPETARMDDLSLAQRLLRDDVVDRVLKRDLTVLYNVRNVLELERLFIYLCLNSGGILIQEKLAQHIGVSRTTVANDLKYLEFAHLIYRLEPVGTGGKRVLRPRSKVYLADSALRNAVLLRGEEVLTDVEEMGLIVETSVLKHLHAFYYPERPEIGYWRGEKDKEVDIVVRRPDGREILVEVKYRNDPQITKGSGLYLYAAQSKPTTGLVITKSAAHFGPVPTRSEDEFQPFMVPAYVFLYLSGHAERNSYSRRLH